MLFPLIKRTLSQIQNENCIVRCAFDKGKMNNQNWNQNCIIRHIPNKEKRKTQGRIEIAYTRAHSYEGNGLSKPNTQNTLRGAHLNMEI